MLKSINLFVAIIVLLFAISIYPQNEKDTVIAKKPWGPAFIDKNGDGICDYAKTHGQGRRGWGRGRGKGRQRNFIDRNRDGICDNAQKMMKSDNTADNKINDKESGTIIFAVAANGKSEKSKISSSAARCPYYLIFNSKGKLKEIIDNPYKDKGRAAGPTAAGFLARKGVRTIIAANFGHKMIGAIESNDMSHFERQGRAKETVNAILKELRIKK